MATSSAGMDSVLCLVDDNGACFAFPEGSDEYMPHSMLHKSSMVQNLLSAGGGARMGGELTLVAPSGYLRSWIDLRRLLTDPAWICSLQSSDIVHFVQVIPGTCPSVQQKESKCCGSVHVSLPATFLSHTRRLPISSQMNVQLRSFEEFLRLDCSLHNRALQPHTPRT